MPTVQITVKNGVIACTPNRLKLTASREPSVEWTCKEAFEVRFKSRTPFKHGKRVFKKGERKEIRKDSGPPKGSTKPKEEEYKYSVKVGKHRPLDPFIDVS